jgi:hypothetical protein
MEELPMAKKKEPGTEERLSWFDEKTHEPLIERYARQLDSFVETMADGKVEPSEILAQEKRLVTLMKEIEPELDDAMHAKVTKLLCELTAYDLMQTIAAMQAVRPKTAFRG